MLLVSLLRLYLRAGRRNFLQSLADPLLMQDRCLRLILKSAAQTHYGQSLGLSGDEDYLEFSRKVPLVHYEQLSPWIEEQRHAQKSGHLTPGAIVCYEPTSGSSGVKKAIPYNDALMGSFNRLFQVWSADVLGALPKLRSGRFYFSVTPVPDTDLSDDASLVDDASYVQGILQSLLRAKAAVPSAVKHIRRSDDFFMVLSCYLLAAHDLELISIWNPSFFLQILAYMEENQQALIALLAQGHCELNGRMFRWNKLGIKRLRQLQAGFDWPQVWPQLRLISCWDAARAGMSAARLREIFPTVLVQGKGLLATEAPITLPIIALQGHFPLLDEVFLEFLDDAGQIHRLHELTSGQTYELIITQKGGFLRYRLGDRVLALASAVATPQLVFLERMGLVSDLTGEKLHESALRSAMQAAGADLSAFWLALPSLTQQGRGQYTLVTDSANAPDAARLEQELLQLHHYALARKLRQLAALELIVEPRARALYADVRTGQGMKLGDMKNQLLIRDLELSARILASFGRPS